MPLTVSTPVFQSTPPARGATALSLQIYDSTGISIHAPREGGDYFGQWCYVLHDISIHAPREGGDFLGAHLLLFPVLFQSTPPARGATSI